jgi:methionine sulfoxide reductase heme-binding subunit
MVCFVVLLPLAVTSNNLAIRRLGGKAWQRLHRFVYLAAILERISAELNRDSPGRLR